MTERTEKDWTISPLLVLIFLLFPVVMFMAAAAGILYVGIVLNDPPNVVWVAAGIGGLGVGIFLIMLLVPPTNELRGHSVPDGRGGWTSRKETSP